MINLINRSRSWPKIILIIFIFSLLIIFLATAPRWIDSCFLVSTQKKIFSIVLFIITLLPIHKLLKLHQKTANFLTANPCFRIALTIYIAFPTYYVFSSFISLATVNYNLTHISVASAVFGLLVTRVSTPNTPAAKMLRRRILVFGTGYQALAVKRALDHSDPSAEIIGFFPGANEDQPQVTPNMILSRDMSLTDTAHTLNADEIVVALSERRGGSMPLRELLDCKLQGIRVLDLASHFEQTLGQIRLDSLYAGWLIFGEGFRQGSFRTAIKRLFDIICASILIVFAFPVMFITAALIVIEDGLPLLYRQERVGLNGRLFYVIKFRSMRRDAEKDGKPIWAQAQDSRVTRIGQIIRKLRIDELPQLFSVIKGDMSLVGPRPERPFFVDQLTKEIPFYAVRHSVKPGVTGWAQVRYHYGATVEDSAEKLQYDLYYVKNHSLLLDIVILFETIGVVLTGKGAH